MIDGKISKKHLIGGKKSRFLKEFIEYSEDMDANQEKSKKGVRYTSYLTSLFDISWFWFELYDEMNELFDGVKKYITSFLLKGHQRTPFINFFFEITNYIYPSYNHLYFIS